MYALHAKESHDGGLEIAQDLHRSIKEPRYPSGGRRALFYLSEETQVMPPEGVHPDHMGTEKIDTLKTAINPPATEDVPPIHQN